MKKIALSYLIVFTTSLSLLTAGVPGLDSLDLSDNIESVELEISPYNHKIDTSYRYYFVANHKDGYNLYISKKRDADYIHIFKKDTVYTYSLKDSTYANYLSRYLEYTNQTSLLKNLIEKSNTVSEDNLYRYRVNYKSKMQFDTNKNISKYTLIINDTIGNYYSDSYLKWNYKNLDEIEWKSTVIEDNDTFYLSCRHYKYKRGGANKIFTELENFYNTGRHKFKPKQEEDDKKEKKKRAKRVEVGDTLNFDFELTGVNRETINARDFFEDNDYVMIYNWGVWCGFCHYNKGNIKEFHEKYKDKVKFITINCESSRATLDEVETYVEREKLNYPVYAGCDFLDENGIKTYPSMLVINKDYEVVEILTSSQKDISEYENLAKKYILTEGTAK